MGHCWNRGFGSHNCDANEEAGVICSNETDPGRLNPMPSKASGKVFEVMHCNLNLKTGSVTIKL